MWKLVHPMISNFMKQIEQFYKCTNKLHLDYVSIVVPQPKSYGIKRIISATY
jgi:hypothetical protein